MRGEKQIITNVGIGFVAQIISLILNFVSRTFFVQYIGVEILAISETLSSIVTTLSLIDLGFYSTVIYRLYKPLINKKYDECSEILSVFRRFYICIAGILSVIFICAIPFIRFFLNGVAITPFVYSVYALICLNTVVSYLLSYKRTLLYADGKDSVAKSIDCVCNVFFSSVRIAVLILTSNFLLYLIFTVLQTIISNFVLHIYCKRHYTWVRKTNINREILKKLFSDTKNVIAAKVAGYVYTSTDNLVISYFLQTITVGFYSNYIVIHSALRMLGASVLSQIAPFVGKKYAECKDSNVHKSIIWNSSFICFLMAGMFVVPFYLLADQFIQSWLGNDYVLPMVIVFLCIDLYIEIQQSTYCLYFGAAGLFAEDKKISIIGAVVNIVGSVIMVQIFGLCGVILGTVLSQCVYWILRGKSILKGLFNVESLYIKKIIFINLIYIAVLCLSVILLKYILQCVYVDFSAYIICFVVQGLICELCFLSICVLFFGRTPQFKYVLDSIFKVGLHGKLQ